MHTDKTLSAAIRFRRVTMLIIVLLTAALIFQRVLEPVITDPDAPYPLRMLATAEPSTLLLLTLVLLVILLVDSRRGLGERRRPREQIRSDQSEVV